MHIFGKHRPRIIILVLAFFIILVPIVWAQSGIDAVLITDVNASEFPEIRVRFRAVNSNNEVVRNVSGDALTVYENGEQMRDVSIDTADRAPIIVVFLIDQGQYFDFQGVGADVIRQSMAYLSDPRYFRDDYDTVAILTRRVTDGEDVTRALLPPTQTSSDFVNEVNSLSFTQTGRTNGLGGIESGMAEIAQLVQPGKASTAVIYVGSIIDDVQGQSSATTRARSLAALAKDERIRLHVLHTEPDGQFADPFLELTRNAGGQYVPLSATEDNTFNLDRLYQDLLDQALVHQLTYNSRSNMSGVRNVVVVPAGVPLDAVADGGESYTIEVETPQVTLSLPTTDINRRPRRDAGGDTWTYQVDTVPVEVAVSWDENPPREIVAADLVVNDKTVLTVQPNVENGRFQLTWDITDIEDDTLTLPVQVRVRDQLDVEAASPSVQVTVNATLPREVVRETAVPQPTPLPTVDPCVADPGGPDCLNEQAQRIAPWTIIITAVVVVAALLVVGLIWAVRRSSGEEPAANEREREAGRVPEVQQTLVGGGGRIKQNILATLRVDVARSELIGEEIGIYANTTKLGRNPRLVDIQLINENDISTVSGLHCTIQYEPSRNLFFITDDNSSNGTAVNGQPLRANDPFQLNDGDEIVLGELARRGAKVTFSIATSQATVADMEREDNEGRMMGNETLVDDMMPNDRSRRDKTLNDTDMLGMQPPPADDPVDADDSWLDEL